MIPDVFMWDAASNNRAFLWGQASIIQNAISAMRSMERSNPALARQAVLALPAAGPAGRLAAANVIHCYVLWKFSDKAELAKRFLIDLVAAGDAAFRASEFYNLPCFPRAVPDLPRKLGAAKPGPAPKTAPDSPRIATALLAEADRWSAVPGHPGYVTPAVDETVAARGHPRHVRAGGPRRPEPRGVRARRRGGDAAHLRPLEQVGGVLATSIAGSLPKPAWLAAPETLWAPWRLPPETLLEGQRDAVLLALREQEQAGIDVVTDGEQTRRHFVHGFAERLEGIDPARRARVGIRGDRYIAEVPTVVGPVRRPASVHAEEAAFARANTTRRLKWTLPGPMTLVDTVADAHYGDRARLALDVAAALNAEARELAALGVDVIQFDEPAFNVDAYLPEIEEWGIAALERAVEGVDCDTAVHICYGYGIKANVDWKATLGRRVAAVRADVPVAGAEPHRPGLGGVRGLARAARAAPAPRRQGRPRRRDRRGVPIASRRLRRWPARSGGCWSTSRPRASCRARTAAWRPCPATWRAASSGRSAAAPPWCGRSSG